MTDKHCNNCANLTKAETCAILQTAVLVRHGSTGNALRGINVGVRDPVAFCCNFWNGLTAPTEEVESGDDASD